MPPGGIEAPAYVTNHAKSQRRRCPAKPVTPLIASTEQNLRPAKPDPLAATKNPLYAVGVVTAKLWRISALAPCEGAYGRVHKPDSNTTYSHTILSYIIHLLKRRHPGRWPGRGRFSGWVGRRGCRRRVLMWAE